MLPAPPSPIDGIVEKPLTIRGRVVAPTPIPAEFVKVFWPSRRKWHPEMLMMPGPVPAPPPVVQVASW
jgi:hypothetical protein